jgi:hypothetical protein
LPPPSTLMRDEHEDGEIGMPNATPDFRALTAAPGAARRSEPDKFTFAFAAASLALASACGLSPQTLVALHYDYYFGALPEKVHPATYIAGASLGLQFFIGDRDRLLAIILNNKGAILLPLSATALAIDDALFLAVPATTLIDTWILPAELFLLCVQLNARERRALGAIVCLFFVANALLGIIEAVANRRLVPLVVANAVTGNYFLPIEWRASALLGHPLCNSYLTGCFILLVALEPRIGPVLPRLCVLAVCSISMLAFGSRAAMVFLPLFLGLALAGKLVKALATGKIASDVLVYSYGAILAGGLGVPVLLASGFADRFLARFDVDHGSAYARTGAMEMVANLSLAELIKGIPRVEMVALGARYQSGEAVENFWLAFLLSFGLIGYLIFMPSLFMFCRNLVRSSNTNAIPALIYFFACCSTSVSISSKSLMVAILTGLIMTGRKAPLSVVARCAAPARRLAVFPGAAGARACTRSRLDGVTT